jgi:hypothetical protein
MKPKMEYVLIVVGIIIVIEGLAMKFTKRIDKQVNGIVGSPL